MISLLADKQSVALVFQAKVWQIQNQYIKAAMSSAARVLEDEYRRVLRDEPIMKGRLGNPSFQIAWMTVAKKVRMFRDGNGAWAVIGNECGPSGRSLSPQAWFAEEGTVERFTKAGEKRGMMPAQHYLRRAAARAMPVAVEVFWAKLRELIYAGAGK